MSEFSQLLSEYIHTKDIRIYSLAEYCGIDRSLMYKIIHGKRTPSSLKTVDKIADYLRLTPGESRELTEAYCILQQGRDNFYRRKDVLNFLDNFRNIAYAGGSPSEKTEPPRYLRDTAALNSESEVNQAVYNIITQQLRKKDGRINMLISPDYSFLINLLATASQPGRPAEINHIICLNNTEQIDADKKNYNLHCLMNILPLCSAGCRYRPRYYYDNITSRLDTFRLFSFMILTEDGAVLLSETLREGLFTSQSDLLALFNTIYFQYTQLSRPLLQKIDSASEQLRYIQEFIAEDSSAEYSFQMTPCMTCLLTDEFLEKYVNPDLPSREQFIRHLKEHIKITYNRYQTAGQTIIFSEEGLADFLDTGRIEEYPADIYSRPLEEDRLKLVECFVEECRKHFRNFRMLRHSIGTVRNGANIYITERSGYLLFTPVGGRQPICLDIRESGLLSAFWDFFENLDNNLFYPPDEALDRMELLVQRYKETYKQTC